MISALHLLWIVPLSAFLGFFFAGLMHTAAGADRQGEAMLREYRKGKEDPDSAGTARQKEVKHV